jgi:hypothetical protein
MQPFYGHVPFLSLPADSNKTTHLTTKCENFIISPDFHEQGIILTEHRTLTSMTLKSTSNQKNVYQLCHVSLQCMSDKNWAMIRPWLRSCSSFSVFC